MRFRKAIEHLAAGRPIRRHAWPKDRFIFRSENKMFTNSGKEFLITYSETRCQDWELLERKEACQS